MPFNLPVAKKGAGAPEVDDGLAIGKFTDLRLVPHPDFIGKDSFGNDDDGERYHFIFDMIEADGSAIYAIVDGEPTGDPLTLDGMTNTRMGKKSNFRAMLAGILTATEFAAWDAQTEEDPYDFSAVQGRPVNVKITHSKGGWPQIDQTIGPAKIKAAK